MVTGWGSGGGSDDDCRRGRSLAAVSGGGVLPDMRGGALCRRSSWINTH